MALRLKDSVDLEKLKDFGFKYSEDNEEYYIIHNSEKIAIQQRNKYIYLEYLENGFFGNIIEENALTILFDLIQAGLVEKVKD